MHGEFSVCFLPFSYFLIAGWKILRFFGSDTPSGNLSANVSQPRLHGYVKCFQNTGTSILGRNQVDLCRTTPMQGNNMLIMVRSGGKCGIDYLGE